MTVILYRHGDLGPTRVPNVTRIHESYHEIVLRRYNKEHNCYDLIRSFNKDQVVKMEMVP